MLRDGTRIFILQIQDAQSPACLLPCHAGFKTTWLKSMKPDNSSKGDHEMEAQVHFHGELLLFRQRMSDEGSDGAVKAESLIYGFSFLA